MLHHYLRQLGRIALLMIIGGSVSSALPAYAFKPQPFATTPAFIEADHLAYDAESDVVSASGHVEVLQGGRILMADKLIYNKANKQVMALGNVSLMEPDGNVYFASEAELEDDLKSGVIQHFRMRFKDNSLLAANKAVRVSAEKVKLDDAVYSACKLCPENPSKAPFWQIKAHRITINETKEKVSYKHAHMEFYGLPIAYTPYFSHPTPGAKRENGFLTPTYRSIQSLGATIEVPYYYVISDNMDVTFSPILTSQEGPVLKGEFRHFPNIGYYELGGSITNPDERDDSNTRTGERDIRGHVDAKGRFDLGNDWEAGFNARRTTDKTYLRLYKISNEDRLISRAFTQKLMGRDYFLTEMLSFQGLNPEEDQRRTPYITPFVSYYTESPRDRLGGRFGLDSNLMILSRDEGIQSRRISSTGLYRVPFITPGGHLLEARTSLRADAYSVDNNLPRGISGDNRFDAFTGRVVPQVELEWSYPLMRSGTSLSMILEPVVHLVASPYGGNFDRIPNEDSQDLELSEVNLFSANRFTGRDRIETGPRTNYGLRGGIYSANGENLNFLIGQNYRVKPQNAFAPEGGITENFSDYVGGIALSNGSWLDASHRFRIDKDNFALHRSETSVGMNLHPVRLSTDYVAVSKSPPPLTSDGRKQIFANSALELNENWTLSANGRIDLSEEESGLISTAGGVAYANDCFRFSAILSRDLSRLRDIEPSTSVAVRFSLKNITQ